MDVPLDVSNIRFSGYVRTRSRYDKDVPTWVRGIFWAGVIITVEYFSGLAIRALVGVCPWDYGKSTFAVDGLIRLDYVPFWYVVGLLFEKLHDLLDRQKIG